jgi:lipoprotein-anchoring transpeptidase ErfK/SrfK
VRFKSILVLILLPLLILAPAACTSGGIELASDSPGNTATLGATGPRALVRSTATADTPTPVEGANRADCDQIRGTQYDSTQEREWFLANCVPTSEPAPDVPAPNPPAIPGPEVAGERWILVSIADQTATAMIGNEPLYTSLVTTGVDGLNTPVGTWKIEYRVENETMTSASIGADEYYVLKDVLYTQYFTNEGHALHLNYWRSDGYFGNIRSSHGCVGMRLADAAFFWRFATIGTRVTIR